VAELILRGEIDGIKEVMQKSENLGMQTFDTALFHLWKDGKISLDEALKNADSANNLRLRVKLYGEQKTGDLSDNLLEKIESQAEQSGEAKSSTTFSGLSLELVSDDEDSDADDNV